MPTDYLIRGRLADLDPDVHELIQIETERQYRKLILIASESSAPRAVLEALNSSFNNIYAEGYPDDDSRWMTEAEILDYPARLAHYRRYSDPRYYKGVEYANTVEALARRRCAELFASDRAGAGNLWVNVQALSGGPANNAVYHALVQPGDTVMGMDLLHGGHLSHGSRVNRSGKTFNVVAYGVDPRTERIDYDEVARLARENKPRMIIAGFSSYPWAPDWERFRQIADSVGAYLLADIAHIAGPVAAGVIPSPVGLADVVSFTSHKSLCGPRGAVILTHRRDLAKKIDRAVFPGEQGGPHLNNIAALAVLFKLNQSPAFKELQAQIVKNAVRFAARMEAHGFRIPFGGTDTHLFNVDCKSVVGPDGTPLSGDLAARVLDLAGIVVNRNTIPGDRSALNPSGLRLGTPWITQRGFREPEIDRLAEYTAAVLKACQPYGIAGRRASRRGKRLQRTKVDFETLNDARRGVRDLAEEVGIDFEPASHGYPHFYYLDDPAPDGPYTLLDIQGAQAEAFLNRATSCDVLTLEANAARPASVTADGLRVEGVLMRIGAGREHYHLTVPAGHATLVATWLRDLSDGYIAFDAPDPFAKLPGPVVVGDHGPTEAPPPATGESTSHTKPWHIGISSTQYPISNTQYPTPLPEFTWAELKDTSLKTTPLNQTHKKLGARMTPFAGWEMPEQYAGVTEERQAVRRAAGLFDLSHMGVWEASGPTAAAFLDSVCANDIGALGVGQSLYTHLLDPDGDVIDDLLVYRRDVERFLLVVNAANDVRDWAWLNAVREGRVLIDRERPWATAPGREACTLRNLRDRASAGGYPGEDMRVDIALLGPKSGDVLLALGAGERTAARIKALKRAQLCEATVGGFDLIVSRTGFADETIGFELFLHPDRAVEFWNALLKAGEPSGLKPCGLASAATVRTGAGRPLHGHEPGGPPDLGASDADIGRYVRLHKPWFIGRRAFILKHSL